MPKPYRIRLAAADDIPALLALEDATLRSSSEQIQTRIAAFPKGQLVGERDGEVIGAVYTQRIANPAALQGVTADTLETLHQDDGSVGQLLWLLAHPERRDRIDAEELLDFALDYLAAMDGVQRVVGVTRCGRTGP